MNALVSLLLCVPIAIGFRISHLSVPRKPLYALNAENIVETTTENRNEAVELAKSFITGYFGMSATSILANDFEFHGPDGSFYEKAKYVMGKKEDFQRIQTAIPSLTYNFHSISPNENDASVIDAVVNLQGKFEKPISLGDEVILPNNEIVVFPTQYVTVTANNGQVSNYAKLALWSYSVDINLFAIAIVVGGTGHCWCRH